MKRLLPVLMVFGVFLFNGEKGWSDPSFKGLTAAGGDDLRTVQERYHLQPRLKRNAGEPGGGMQHPASRHALDRQMVKMAPVCFAPAA